jgi:Uma2 family endonuclease
MDNVKMPPSREAEPAWEVAHLFPAQGEWSEEEYLALDTNRLVEFSHGYLEVLPTPTQSHQFMVLYLYQVLLAFVQTHQLGVVLTAPLRVQLWPGKHREPDIVFMLAEHDQRRHEQYWQGADLVMEVISPDDRHRDWVTKRREYAQAGIPEYWLVDRQNDRILVLRLEEEQYTVHGEFGPGQQATSALLPGFSMDVTAVFAAAV